jgi:hypothetical protein
MSSKACQAASPARGVTCENTGNVQPPAEHRSERSWVIRVVRGSICRAVEALASRAERRRDREAADFISRNGQKLTDEIERQIVDRARSKRPFGPP